jgi:flagellar hook assembly protein FlgD
VTVGIYDVGGRLVTTLTDGERTPGRHELVWDGRGPGGQPLAAGVYWARVAAGDERAATRFTVVR